MKRRLGLAVLAVVLSTAILPSSVAAAGQGGIFHGGKPGADVTVTCALHGYEYDVFATINPDLVVETFTNGEADALAWDKTSAKTSALSVFLGNLDVNSLVNIAVGDNLWGEGTPFNYVLVQFGYWDLYDTFHVLGSGTGRCKPGSLPLE